MDVSESELLRTFTSVDKDDNGRVWAWELLSSLGQAGIQPTDPRVRAALADVRGEDGREIRIDIQPVEIDFRQYAEIAQHGDGVVYRALAGQLAVSPEEFREYARSIEAMYADLLPNRDGHVADYIPTLRDADPEKFGIAICTADGQVFSIGDTTDEFSVQSTSKPFNYAIALEQLGPEEVHRWVGQEQSGGPFNDPNLSLGRDGRPRNPMINAGAIGTLALVDTGQDQSARFTTVRDTWAAMTGKRPELHGATFLAERDTGFGNVRFANGLMQANKLRGARPNDRRAPEDAVEFYTMICSLNLNAELLARAGATLANGGVAPSGERVFSPETAGRVLAVMGHSGMYDGSGEFSDQVGLPAKSGVSGNVMMVVPSEGLAVVTYSPRLDPTGNSVRGVEVCKRFVNEFGLHPYRGTGAERGRPAAAGSGQQFAGALNEADRRAEAASAVDRALGGLSRPGTGGAGVLQTTDAERTGVAATRRAAQPGQQL
ncbi:L-glutaminase [Kribbella rubisoli]|uniref:Glutaminase n=1 Tax=Kribbella rubisoli TaxID=3075929 RepID=A0A4Q7W209_9ACTN|nr:glutaminase A [Kribbella rubisoli]RZU03282.1 L-glutaminase [Kribbella rubisoli]